MHPARWIWSDGTRSTFGWIARARLDTAALAMADADRLEAKAVTAPRGPRLGDYQGLVADGKGARAVLTETHSGVPQNRTDVYTSSLRTR
ncbi:hypothetical protein OHA19_01635 [Streptomyces sp. NBC_00012]|uniref:hypothetical protein n=1 Tax=Streptomyces sp. NBC_00012 TaxID=2975621 RepID=UPI0032446CEE